MATPARDYRAIHAIADKLTPSLRRKFLQAVEQLRGRISFAAIERAIRAGGITIELSQALNQFPRDLRPAVRILNEAFAQAAQVTAGRGDLRLAAAFTLTNALAVEAADVRSAALVREVTNETRRAIQNVIARAFQQGITAREAAQSIRPLIGLTSRQAAAVMKLRTAKGAAAADRYAAQLLKHRALTIARTETIRASVDGQLAIWRQAQRQGLLPNNARKRWIVTPDDRLCPQCAPLRGVEVPLNSPFPGGVDGPPLHPNCRCAVSIQTGERRRSAAA